MSNDPDDQIYDARTGRLVPDPAKKGKRRRKRRRNRIGGCFGCLVNLILLLVVIVLLPLVVGMVLQVFQSRDENYVVPGRLVDVNGNLMHIYCTGEGSPTVLLDSDIGGWSIHWTLVQARVSEFTRVCSYDRAGYGWSEAGPEPRTLGEIALELHLLLRNAGEEGPFVLVGHGLMGPAARLYTHNFSDDVAGMVLLDSYTADQFDGLVADLAWRLDAMQVAGLVAPIGTVRLADLVWHYDERLLQGAALPDPQAEVFRAGTYKADYWRTLHGEYTFLSESADQMRQVGDLGDRPLVVLSAINRPESAWPDEDAHRDAQQALVELSTDGEWVVSETGRHFIQVDNPVLVTVAIQNVVDKVNQ